MTTTRCLLTTPAEYFAFSGEPYGDSYYHIAVGGHQAAGLLGVDVSEWPPERQVVLTAMSCRPGRVIDSIADPLAVMRFAEANLVGPLVAKWLLDRKVRGAAITQYCEDVYRASADRMGVLMGQLDLVADALDAVDIPVVGLKNAGIARGIIPDPALCPMGDIDVLVATSNYRAAHDAVVGAGFELASRSVVEAADLEAGEHGGGTEYVRRVDGHDVWLELQWRPVAGRWIRPEQEPSSEELMARSVPIDGTKLRLLEPTDNMLQVCLHTAKHSYVRSPGLRLHTDVDRLAYYQPPDWERLVRLAADMSVQDSVYFSLALARDLLDSRIPDEVLSDLRPPRWKVELMKRWFMRVDLFFPEEQKFRRPEMLAFQSMLYDDVRALAASVFDVPPAEVRARNAVQLARSGAKRIEDLVTRYQS